MTKKDEIKLTEEEKLRVWCIEHPCPTLNFFEGYRWLEKGIEVGDLSLRKSCMTRLYGLFRNPQDALEWVKSGTVPPYLKEEDCKVLDKTETEQSQSD